jgi:hypothetical protein
MRILLTSDWQCSYDNLELCKQAAEEILELRREHDFQVLVLCGDLKHVYNPVDLRVINFWQRTIKRWNEELDDVVVLLGNHDRLGMHNERPNWMPVLRNAGAKCFDEPSYHRLSDGFRLLLGKIMSYALERPTIWELTRALTETCLSFMLTSKMPDTTSLAAPPKTDWTLKICVHGDICTVWVATSTTNRMRRAISITQVHLSPQTGVKPTSKKGISSSTSKPKLLKG